jgi:hypothetical protein
MKTFAPRFLLVALLMLALPMSLAHHRDSHTGGGGGSASGVRDLTQLVEDVQQEAITEAVAVGLITVQVIAQNVNVQALNNINLDLDVTVKNVLNNLSVSILDESQLVVNVLSIGGNQIRIQVVEVPADFFD